MRYRDYLTAAGVAALLSACGSPKQVVTSNDPVLSKWSGSFTATVQRSGTLTPGGSARATGNVAVMPADEAAKRVHVAFTLNIPTSNTQLRWAMLPDRCGSGDLPLIGFDQFPLLEIGTNGRGTIESDLPLEMLPNNSYHVNVYRGGQQLDNVVACANLRYEAVR